MLIEASEIFSLGQNLTDVDQSEEEERRCNSFIIYINIK